MSSSLVRIGLIGAGRWGQVYLRTLALLQERCRLTHVATSRPEAVSRYPQPVTVTPDWRALIRAECDAVIIATPPAVHAEMGEACLEARAGALARAHPAHHDRRDGLRPFPVRRHGAVGLGTARRQPLSRSARDE